MNIPILGRKSKSNPASPRTSGLPRTLSYHQIHREQWERIKNIDFPDGAVVVRDDQGKPLVHRPFGRRVIRQMARDASRRMYKEMRKKYLAARDALQAKTVKAEDGQKG
jgi:hypothetical protein